MGYVTTNLEVWLNAGNVSSYPGSGNIWNDLSGNSRNATLFNGPVFNNTVPKNIEFDRTPPAEYSTILNTGGLAGESFTFNCFLSFQNFTDPFYILAKGVDSGYATYWFEAGSTGFLRVGVGTSITYFYAPSFAGEINTWYYLTGVYHANTLYFYINGVLIGTVFSIGTVRYSTTNIALGLYSNDLFPGVGATNSRMHDFSYYSRNLSPAEILQNYRFLRGTEGKSNFLQFFK